MEIGEGEHSGGGQAAPLTVTSPFGPRLAVQSECKAARCLARLRTSNEVDKRGVRPACSEALAGGITAPAFHES